MKSLSKVMVPCIIALALLTQCDPITSNESPTEQLLSKEAKEALVNSTTKLTLLSPEQNADKVSTNLEFKWTRISGVSLYEYQLSDNSTFNSFIKKTTVEGNSYKPDVLTYQKKYYWRVKPAADGYEWSEVRSFTTGIEGKIAPSTLELLFPFNNADKVSTDLQFEWTEMTGASGYEYQLSDNSTFSSILTKASVEGTSYQPGILTAQKKYYWRVRAAGDGNEWTEVWSFTTGIADEQDEQEVTTEMILLSPEQNADKVSTNLEFTWKKLSGASSYEYQLSDNSTFNSILQKTTVEATSYMPGGLVHQKKYYWRVKGDVDGTGWSDVWSFTTGIAGDDGTDPAVVLNSPSDNAFDLSINPGFAWEEVSGVSDYEFQLAENSSFSPLSVESVEFGTTYQASNLDYQTQYYWKVRVNGDSNEWSNTRSFTTISEPVSPPPSSGSFVQVQNSDFVVDGNVMHVAGTNAYYLPNYEKLNPGVVDRALDLFETAGINVVRMWGFYDGFDCGYSQHDSNENVIQTSPGVYSESALRDLDNVIAKGKERGIRFIIPFINYWDELGGVCQYNTWAGASNPSTNLAFFLSNSDTQKWYKDYIKMLLNRVNTVTGIAYKNEPAIAAWQIMNEGRNPGASPQVLHDWYQEMAQYIKSIDSNHLLSTGEEGFDDSSLGLWNNDGSFTHPNYSTDQYANTYVLRAGIGSSYVLNTAIPEIDFGNAHWYPSEYGFGTTIDEDLLRAQRAWLSDHKNIAEDSGKPSIIGEFGFPGWGDEQVSTMYSALYQHAELIGLDGNYLWQLAADGTKCWEFGGNICYPGGRTDTQLYNEFKQHVSNMNNLH